MKVIPWNRDKPHRCPECHAVVVSGKHKTDKRHVYQCCLCSTRFARFPKLAPILIEAGLTCRCDENNREE